MRTIIRLKERKEKWVKILGNGEVRLGLRMQENEKKRIMVLMGVPCKYKVMPSSGSTC